MSHSTWPENIAIGGGKHPRHDRPMHSNGRYRILKAQCRFWHLEPAKGRIPRVKLKSKVLRA